MFLNVPLPQIQVSQKSDDEKQCRIEKLKTNLDDRVIGFDAVQLSISTEAFLKVDMDEEKATLKHNITKYLMNAFIVVRQCKGIQIQHSKIS